MPHGIKGWAISVGSWTVFTVLGHFLFKLADNAMLTWTDDKIAWLLGLRSPQLSTVISWIVPALFVIVVFLTYHHIINSRGFERARERVQSYLHDEDSELGSAIRDMATYSAWAKWFASQFLANNNHQPVSQHNLMTIASGEVLRALMDGKILARGRTKWKPRSLWRLRQPSDAIEYEDISREAWRLAGIRMEPHPNTLWRASVFPRSDVDPERIKKLLDYDSIIVDSRKFEKLWPRVDKSTDDDRMKLLDKAKTVGANPEHIEKLRKGHMATWP